MGEGEIDFESLSLLVSGFYWIFPLYKRSFDEKWRILPYGQDSDNGASPSISQPSNQLAGWLLICDFAEA